MIRSSVNAIANIVSDPTSLKLLYASKAAAEREFDPADGGGIKIG
jgi:hypothetical protein